MKQIVLTKIIIVQLFICLFVNPWSIYTHGLAGSTYIKNMGIGWKVLDQHFNKRMYEDEFVASYVVSSKQVVKKKVASAGKSKTNCYIKINFENEDGDDILCTPTQEFYVPELEKWVSACALNFGDKLLSYNQEVKIITHLEFVKKPLNVYSIEVEDTHNFYVGRHSVLTHNMVIPIMTTLSIGVSFGSGATAGGSAGSFFGPIGVVGGIALGGIIGIGVAYFSKDKTTEYRLAFNEQKIDDIFSTKSSYHERAIGSIMVTGYGSNCPSPNEDPEDDKGETEIKISNNENDIKHMFRKSEGHLQDTPHNRNLLTDMTSNKNNFQGTDKFGSDWYTKTLKNGKQLWAQVRKGFIKNGGINESPKSFNSNTGLCQQIVKG